MFHVKQNSFNSTNPLAFCFYKMHTVWLVCFISLPLPWEGIKGRGRGGREVVYVPRETLSLLFSEK